MPLQSLDEDDVSLALAYSTANVTVVLSIQEAFGQTALESPACGTPIVAFNATGLRDIVDRQQNGYLATPYEVDNLTRGILWVLENQNRYALLSQAGRNKAER